MAGLIREKAGIRELLEGDHERLDRLFDELLCALGSDAREDVRRLWAEFEQGLLQHMEMEEKYVLPKLREVAPAEGASLLQEHAEICARLSDLGVGIDLHQLPADVAARFVEQLRQHARREGALAYRLAERELMGSRAQALRDALEAARTIRQRLAGLLEKAGEHAPPPR